MTDHKRPGGLTALAVINFIFGGLSLLGALGMAILLPFLGGMAEQAATQDIPPEQLAQIEAMSEISGGLFIGLALFSLLSAALLIASGVGYLQLKKFLGRVLGNTNAVVGILSTAGSAVLLPVALGGGFNIMVILGLIFPVLTLFLLNVTFKEDFVN